MGGDRSRRQARGALGIEEVQGRGGHLQGDPELLKWHRANVAN